MDVVSLLNLGTFDAKITQADYTQHFSKTWNPFLIPSNATAQQNSVCKQLP